MYRPGAERYDWEICGKLCFFPLGCGTSLLVTVNFVHSNVRISCLSHVVINSSLDADPQAFRLSDYLHFNSLCLPYQFLTDHRSDHASKRQRSCVPGDTFSQHWDLSRAPHRHTWTSTSGSWEDKCRRHLLHSMPCPQMTGAGRGCPAVAERPPRAQSAAG